MVSYEEGKARDVFIGLTHFTSAFLLLILATLSSMIFGFLLPLLALFNRTGRLADPHVIAAGLAATLVLLAAYFFDELHHYQILSNRLMEDARE